VNFCYALVVRECERINCSATRIIQTSQVSFVRECCRDTDALRMHRGWYRQSQSAKLKRRDKSFCAVSRAAGRRAILSSVLQTPDTENCSYRYWRSRTWRYFMLFYLPYAMRTRAYICDLCYVKQIYAKTNSSVSRRNLRYRKVCHKSSVIACHVKVDKQHTCLTIESDVVNSNAQKIASVVIIWCVHNNLSVNCTQWVYFFMNLHYHLSSIFSEKDSSLKPHLSRI